MDHRDKMLIAHHQKRVAMAQVLSPERQAEWAERYRSQAERQQRFQMLVLATLWLNEITKAAGSANN